MNIKYSVLLVLFYFSGSLWLSAQNKELKFKLDANGSQYVKASFLNQVWIRFNENNPGTKVDGYHESEIFDIGLRRTRIQLFGQLSERVFFYAQFGTNNLSYNAERKQGLFVHDAVGELKVANDYLSIGSGLTGWSGLSRFASPAVGSILTLDAPLYQQATNDVNDQFLRKFSIYAKGKINKLDYRLAITKPMSIVQSTIQGPQIAENSFFSPLPPKLQYQAYTMFQFLEKESNLTPYNAGSYLGKKNVFNVGAGFIYQADAMWHKDHSGTDTISSDLSLLSVDVFFDHILNVQKKNALTAYASMSSNDYGLNYIRNIGVMNPANGNADVNVLNGAGNAFPAIGTGSTAYAQLGYLFRDSLLHQFGTIQTFVAMQYSEFDLLDDPMLMYELGFNWLLDGHHSKLSFNYQSRPVFEHLSEEGWKTNSRKGMFLLQMQIMI